MEHTSDNVGQDMAAPVLVTSASRGKRREMPGLCDNPACGVTCEWSQASSTSASPVKQHLLYWQQLQLRLLAALTP